MRQIAPAFHTVFVLRLREFRYMQIAVGIGHRRFGARATEGRARCQQQPQVVIGLLVGNDPVRRGEQL